MTWKKLDSDTVNADQPLDVFVLRTVSENIEAAHNARLRRWGNTWPADERPILGCHQQLGWMLGIHPKTENVTELTCTIQLKCYDADVVLSLGCRSWTGWTTGPEITVVPGGTTFEELTIDVESHTGHLVLFLLVESDVGANMGTTTNMSGERFARMAIDLNGHLAPLTFVKDERYVMQVIDPLAGSIVHGTDPAPIPRTVAHNPPAAGDYVDFVYAWPCVFYPRLFEQSGQYRIQFDLLGRVELYGYSVFESEVNALQSMTEALTAGNKPAFNALAESYSRGYDFAQGRSIVHHSGPVMQRILTDLYGDTWAHWGNWNQVDSVFSLSYISGCWVGHTSNDAFGTGPDGSITTTDRTTYVIVAAIVIPWRQDIGEIDVEVRAALYSWGGVDWDANAVSTENTNTMITADSRVSRGLEDQQAPLIGFGLDQTVTFHTLRGGWMVDKLMEPGFAGINLIEIVIDDTNPALYRSLEIKPRTVTGDTKDGRTLDTGQPQTSGDFWCPSFLAYVQEGF